MISQVSGRHKIVNKIGQNNSIVVKFVEKQQIFSVNDYYKQLHGILVQFFFHHPVQNIPVKGHVPELPFPLYSIRGESDQLSQMYSE